MSLFIKIDSIRGFEQYPSFLLLYDFEDDLANSLKISINNIRKEKYAFGKLVHKLYPTFQLGRKKDEYTFSIMMTPDYQRIYLNKNNTIPYVIDYWRRYDESFDAKFRHFPLVYISGLEAFEYLKARQTSVNIRHLPLSISDQHMSLFYTDTVKDIDIINVGRKNPILDDYIYQYLQKYSSVNYVHRKMEKGENIYYSSLHGKIGKIESREDLLKTLSRSKIAIVSSPGIDSGENRTGGFNPVTPRVFESAIGKCYMVGRYEKNIEFYDFGLDKLIDLPQSYEDFEKIVNLKLAVPFDRHTDYEEFLKKNLNSNRISQIIDEIKNFKR